MIELCKIILIGDTFLRHFWLLK